MNQVKRAFKNAYSTIRSQRNVFAATEYPYAASSAAGRAYLARDGRYDRAPLFVRLAQHKAMSQFFG